MLVDSPWWTVLYFSVKFLLFFLSNMTTIACTHLLCIIKNKNPMKTFTSLCSAVHIDAEVIGVLKNWPFSLFVYSCNKLNVWFSSASFPTALWWITFAQHPCVSMAKTRHAVFVTHHCRSLLRAKTNDKLTYRRHSLNILCECTMVDDIFIEVFNDMLLLIKEKDTNTQTYEIKTHPAILYGNFHKYIIVERAHCWLFGHYVFKHRLWSCTLEEKLHLSDLILIFTSLNYTETQLFSIWNDPKDLFQIAASKWRLISSTRIFPGCVWGFYSRVEESTSDQINILDFT